MMLSSPSRNLWTRPSSTGDPSVRLCWFIPALPPQTPRPLSATEEAPEQAWTCGSGPQEADGASAGVRHPVWVLAPLFLVLLVPAATAHGDQIVAQETVGLQPGASVTWTRDVHWHRLMGTVRADGPVVLSVTGPEGTVEVAGPGTHLRVRHLVQCCDDEVWTPHTVTLSNAGDAPVRVDADLAFLHDNLAVVAHDAEPGAWWQTLGILLAIVLVPAWRARRPAPVRGAPQQAVPEEGASWPAHRAWLRASRGLHMAAWAVALATAATGMARLGGGPLTGTLGATLPLAYPAQIFNAHAFLMLLLMGLWAAAVACWAGARRRAGSPRACRGDGLVFVTGAVLVGAVWAVGSEAVLWPLVVAFVPAAALLADALGAPRGRTEGQPGS